MGCELGSSSSRANYSRFNNGRAFGDRDIQTRQKERKGRETLTSRQNDINNRLSAILTVLYYEITLPAGLMRFFLSCRVALSFLGTIPLDNLPAAWVLMNKCKIISEKLLN